jgi:hypothetical protein
LTSVGDITRILEDTYSNKFSQEEAYAKIISDKQGQRSTAEFLSNHLALAKASGSTGFDCTQRLVLFVHSAIRDRVLTNPAYNRHVSLETLAALIRDADRINKSVSGDNYTRTLPNIGYNQKTVQASTQYLPTTTATPAYHQLTTTTADPNAMDLDAMKLASTRNAWTWDDVKKKTWAKTPEQKEARRAFQLANSLCYYCDDKDHTMEGCEKLAKAKKKKAERDTGKA